MEHSFRILTIIQERGISAYKLAKETGISESLFSKWKKKPTSEIASLNLVKIASYLDCSVDYLLGRTDDPVTPSSAAHDDLKLRLDQNYSSLNQAGKTALVAISDDMVAGGRYKP